MSERDLILCDELECKYCLVHDPSYRNTDEITYIPLSECIRPDNLHEDSFKCIAIEKEILRRDAGLFTKQEMRRWSQRLSNNPKPDWDIKKYQLHCGFITSDEEKWKSFIDQHEEEIVERIYSKYRSWILLKNGEYWQHYYPNQNCRVYRVLKAKVDKDINKNYFNSVLSQMLVHCYELEWI